MQSVFSHLFLKAQIVASRRFFPDMSASQANVSAHYDIGNIL